MASTSDIRNGLCIKYNHDIYKIIEFLHVKPGKGPAFVRTKLKSVTNGRVVDNTFSTPFEDTDDPILDDGGNDDSGSSGGGMGLQFLFGLLFLSLIVFIIRIYARNEQEE